MNFWILAVALLAIPAAIISWPLFSGSSRERAVAMLLLLLVPLGGLFLYQQIGTPEALNMPATAPHQQQQHTAQQPQMDELVANLQQRMTENPDDAEGWVVLGRSLKTMQRYDEAEAALTNAYRLLPNNAVIMVELAEARLFTAGKPEISAEVQQLLKSALEIDPQQQKGLWLLGMAAAQAGDNPQAAAIWQKLLGLLDPASSAATAVQQQIDMVNAKMGIAPATPGTAAQDAAGVHIPVTITLDETRTTTLPQGAVLFIFIHPDGGVGMPLAVKRIAAPTFPMSLTLSDADTLRPGTSLSDFEQLNISARISMTGVANAASGDYQATPVTVDTKAVTGIALALDQGVP